MVRYILKGKGQGSLQIYTRWHTAILCNASSSSAPTSTDPVSLTYTPAPVSFPDPALPPTPEKTFMVQPPPTATSQEMRVLIFFLARNRRGASGVESIPPHSPTPRKGETTPVRPVQMCRGRRLSAWKGGPFCTNGEGGESILYCEFPSSVVPVCLLQL